MYGSNLQISVSWGRSGPTRTQPSASPPALYCLACEAHPTKSSDSRLRVALAAGRPRRIVEHDTQFTREPYHGGSHERRLVRLWHPFLSDRRPPGRTSYLFRGHTRNSHERRRQDGHHTQNIFEEGLSELFRRAEHDSRLHAVVEKLRTTSKSVFPAAAPEPKLSISHT
ncbi:hypothetical protein H4582DRAFT_511521 [Lactarius indigo]|nr:hypothetical protein H4582DRAFT_511521 [Lactarius indigo]